MTTTSTRQHPTRSAVRSAARWLDRHTPGPASVQGSAQPAGTTRRTHRSTEPTTWHLGGVGHLSGTGR